MKFIQRLILLGIVIGIGIILFLINQLTINFVCRLPNTEDNAAGEAYTDSRLEKAWRGGFFKAEEAEPMKQAIDEKRIKKLRDIVLHKHKIHSESIKYQSPPTWSKIIKRRKASDRYLIPFHLLADQRQLYGESLVDQVIVRDLLTSLSTSPIVDVSEIDGGTQIKLNLTLADGTRALFKPGRFGRDATANPNHFYFSDMERHVSEIAAHHLDRLLGFRRVPPCAGRMVNLTQDIMRLADYDLLKTFFFSPVGNTCFMSHCDYYCDSAHAICGSPDLIEGSMCVYLAGDRYSAREKIRHPWRRSYSKHRKAEWETDENYCKNVTSRSMYARNQRRILDLIDMSVFDFLISNLDRHHYEAFQYDNDDSFTIMLDNGKGFGQPDKDEHSILAPLHQCCFIRLSTLTTLFKYHDGPEHLSVAMRKSLNSDRLPDVLNPGHLRALDRRLGIVLQVVYNCLQVNDESGSYRGSVIIADIV